MTELSDDARAFISAFGAQRFQVEGRQGMVLFVSSPGERDAIASRHYLFYLDRATLELMIKGAQETDPETAAFALIIEGGEMRTEIVSCAGQH